MRKSALFRFFWRRARRCVKFVEGIVGGTVRRVVAAKTPLNPSGICFFTNQGNYSCNPRAIHEELLRRGKDYDMTWAYLESTASPDDIPATAVKRHSADYIRAMASAKVIVANGEGVMSRSVPKKKGQVCINTWHGSLGIKRIDPTDIKTDAVINLCRKSEKYFDINISNSTFESCIYRDTFWPHTEILEVGHPRNDVLVITNEDERRILKERIFAENGIEEVASRICLYAPTFRDNNNTDAYDIDYHSLRETLKRRFGGSWIIFVRLHSRLRKKKIGLDGIFEMEGVFDLTKYPDIQDLLSVADVMITDYSSCICDFVLTKRPAFIYAVDIEEYNTERGFYYSLYDSPWPVAKNNDELAARILEYDDAAYRSMCDEFLREKGCIEDGHASARVADKIIEIIEGTREEMQCG